MGRDTWNRASATIELDTHELDKLLSPVFPRQRVMHAAPAQGGLANTNVCVVISDRDTPVLLRLFQRAPEQACKEFKLNQLVANTVPVPKFFHFAETNEITGSPYIVMEWVDAPRLESIVKDVDGDEILQLGKTLGETARAIHSFKFAEYGFFDRDLNIQNPINLGLPGMLAYAQECLIEKNGKERLGEQVTEEALKFLSERGNILNDWTGPACLTHADFGGSNILVHKKDDQWKVAAVLDWEFAFSGTPFMDFGNLLRRPLGEMSSFVDQFHQAYISSGGVLPESWRKLTALTDLTAWFDFASRPAAGPELMADARSVIMNTIRNWNNL
jgi:aminoglycoside phosphotransferase (APT) family kinase protein